MRANDRSGDELHDPPPRAAALPARIERAMLAILNRPGAGSDHADEIRRELRTLFLGLAPTEANALVRRLDADRADDMLAAAFRRVIDLRRLVR